jgi:thiamine phosphate synthase YjbQ (UPF0047 family)
MRYAVKTSLRNQLIDITDFIVESVRESKVSHGIVNVFVPHTTAE